MKRTKNIVIGTFDYQMFVNLNARLGAADYNIRFIQRGVKILMEILDNDVDLLILDIDLAGLMGMEILPVIRRLRPRLPIILITDDLNLRIRKMAAELGVTYQAYKPITGEEADAIVSATERIMERKPIFEFENQVN